ncbi:MAG TPA: ferritin-like domain-containing protein [Polyangiaceae bacterium]|nr:ferritin-like domain-containing protein [Polyangiaceae bacterium]
MTRIIRDAIALLNRLIELDWRVIDTYRLALARAAAVDAPDAAQLAAFIADHRRHIDELALIVRNLGGEPQSRSDLRGERGAVAAAALGDPAEPRAWRRALSTGEAQAMAAYEDAASRPGIPVDIVAALERGLRDEQRHCAWTAAPRIG